ncbi:hypothetical protein PSHT_04310 [Puccinia striiformis]|uniref:Uncharacterized protein n=1 Tax=Puccinia striiformis TaxID=27350 RepID=A0A2S4WDH7_9BASI|nr:hypothetical protein PSHT_04310 [Puccinia striiformis]
MPGSLEHSRQKLVHTTQLIGRSRTVVFQQNENERTAEATRLKRHFLDVRPDSPTQIAHSRSLAYIVICSTVNIQSLPEHSGISVISNILDMWLWPRNKGRYTSLENKEYGTALPESNQQIYLSLPGNEEGISNEHSERTTITAPIISTKTTCTEDQLPSLILAFPLPNPAREYNRADIPALFL